jgi:hypothetical protein
MAHGKPNAISTAPVRFNDQDFANRLPTCATGESAIFTDHVRAAHLIRRALLCPVAIQAARGDCRTAAPGEEPASFV